MRFALGDGLRRVTVWLDDAGRDLRHALRSLRRNPGFAAVAVVTLSVGIGSGIAVFSLIDGLVLRPLPVRHPEALVLFGRARNWGVVSGVSHHYDVFSYPQYRNFRRNDRFFPGGLAAFASWESPVRLRSGGEPFMAQGELVSGNYFHVLGVAPAVGRLFDDGDDRPEAAPAAVLGYRYWSSRFGGAPDIAGRAIEVNGTPFTIAGVAAPAFAGETLEADPPEVWFPLNRFTEVTLLPSLLDQPDQRWLFLVGRAASGADLRPITAGLTLLLHQWLDANEPQRDQPDVRAAIDAATVEASPGATGVSHLRARYAEPLWILLAIAALVLAIACANITNLLLARAAARRHELSVRLALGAGRWRLVREAIAEGLLLSAIGGAAGLPLAFWLTDGLLAVVFRGAASVNVTTSPDARTAGFAVLTVVASGLVFGLGPAWRAARGDLGGRLHAGARVMRGGFGTGRLLVAGQVALSLVLLVSSGLLVRSLGNLSRQDFGFSADRVLVVHVDPRTSGYTDDQLAPLYASIRRAVNARPGVRSSALALYTPLSGENWSSGVAVEGFSPEQNHDLGSAWVSVTPGYFETMGIPLLLGRRLDERDAAGVPRTAVVNESFVRTVLHGGNPIGRRFGFASNETEADWEIVGVVRDTKHADPRAPGVPTFFLPVTARPPALSVLRRSAYLNDLVVRAAGDPASIAGEVRSALRRAAPRLVATGATTMQEQVQRSFNQGELLGLLSSVFGAIALLLAGVGLYGLLAYAVARRTNEIAVRLALGAEPRRVIGMVARDVSALLAIGLAAGVPLALAAARVIRAQLFGVGTVDPPTVGLAMLVIAAIGAAAAYVPAFRAVRLDPARALRSE